MYHVRLFWDPTNCSLPGSSLHGILQARILEWVAISSSRGSSWPRDQTHVFCTGRQILYHWATWEASPCIFLYSYWKESAYISEPILFKLWLFKGQLKHLGKEKIEISILNYLSALFFSISTDYKNKHIPNIDSYYFYQSWWTWFLSFIIWIKIKLCLLSPYAFLFTRETIW